MPSGIETLLKVSRETSFFEIDRLYDDQRELLFSHFETVPPGGKGWQDWLATNMPLTFDHQDDWLGFCEGAFVEVTTNLNRLVTAGLRKPEESLLIEDALKHVAKLPGPRTRSSLQTAKSNRTHLTTHSAAGLREVRVLVTTDHPTFSTSFFKFFFSKALNTRFESLQ